MKICITRAVSGGMLCGALVACAGHQQEAKEPTPPEAPTSEAAPEQAPKGPGVEAEMQFEDKGDSERKADRAPPPTPAYKPKSKSKSSNAQ